MPVRRRAIAARKRRSARYSRAGLEMLRESSYTDLTGRVRRRPGEGRAATAYTYFSSKNHLIAEVYLDLMREVPYFTDVNEPMPARVEQRAALAWPWRSPTSPRLPRPARPPC